MDAPSLAAFQKDIEAAKRDLDRFATAYGNVCRGDVRYRYYHAEPPSPVPIEVWHYIATDHEGVTYKELDFAPDGAACLCWEEQNFDVKQFKLLCQQCCQTLWNHATLLATVPEIRTVVEMPSGYHSWIRMVHQIATVNPVWSGLVNKKLFVSERPFKETEKDRHLQWEEDDSIEPEAAEEQLVQELHELGKSVPDVWFEYISPPRLIATFYSDTLDTLKELALDSCGEELPAGQQMSETIGVTSTLPEKQSDSTASVTAASVEEEVKPHWDKATRKLCFKGRLIKQFKQPAGRQTLVLAAFEENGWPKKMDDPLPWEKGDPKRRLAQTISSLNKNHKIPNLIYFEADGTGQGILWVSGRKPKPKSKAKPN